MGRRPRSRQAAVNRDQPGRPRFYGRHAVVAALTNPERVKRRLWVTHEAAALLDVPSDLPMQFGDAADLARLVPADAPHQGMVLEVEPLEDLALSDLLAEVRGPGISEAGAGVPASRRPLILLDQVTDPHNVGAILRSAAAFDALGLITQDRHSPGESGALARAASGALELVPWVRVVNLARALDEIGEAGFWRLALAGQASTTLGQALAGASPPALVLGAEGEGLRPNTVAHCDESVRLPISERVESLNVSNAAAIALYAAHVAAPGAGHVAAPVAAPVR